MDIQSVALSPPSLNELVETLKSPLAANYESAAVSVVDCPDLRQAPFHLATEGISGDEKVADIGGQPNLFPQPQLDRKWSMADIARGIDMSPAKGGFLGAGAGPFHIVGQNCELSPNLGWHGGFDSIANQSRYAEIDRNSGAARMNKSPSLDCALMMNLYGSSGEPGQVIKVTARGRKGTEKSFTECIRKAIAAAYGERIVSLGGVFVIKSGRARYHIMPDFPVDKDLPFKDFDALNNWLTYHDFDGPITCLSVMHSADPGKMLGLRMEHTHAYSPVGKDAGGHYHYDLEGDTVEYEGYFNTAKMLYRVDKPAVTLDRDLHD